MPKADCLDTLQLSGEVKSFLQLFSCGKCKLFNKQAYCLNQCGLDIHFFSTKDTKAVHVNSLCDASLDLYVVGETF